METPSTNSPQKTVFICGAGHSGTTLVGLVLGSHSQSFFAGEAYLTRKLFCPTKGEKPPCCNVCGSDCTVWNQLEPGEDESLYRQLRRITGLPVVIDSTKGLIWLGQKIEEAYQSKPQPYLIYMRRDGRSFLSARLRKFPGSDIMEHINYWIAQIEGTNDLFEKFKGPKIELRYEELATNPVPHFQKLCDFAGLDFEPAILNYYNFEHHPLGGNSGTQYLIEKARIGQIHLKLQHQHQNYYPDHPLGIRLDMRWKEELDNESTELFDKLAGHLNRGYEWD